MVARLDACSGLQRQLHHLQRPHRPGSDWNWSHFIDLIRGASTTAPAAPSNLSATKLDSSRITLNWNDNSDNESGFKIERATASGGPWTQIAINAANDRAFTDTGLRPLTTYYYHVRAFNSAGNSGYSNVDSARTDGVPPAAPSALNAATVSASRIDLTWTDNSADESGFKIERAPSSGGPWTQIASTAANVTSFANTGLSGATTYFYRVRAYNSWGDSPHSNVDSATTGNMAPTVDPIANRSVNEGQTLTFTVTATDPDEIVVSQTLADFEAFEEGGPSGTALFRHPAFSSTTISFVNTNATNHTMVVTNFPAGHAGDKVLRATWNFAAGTTNPWLRLSTYNAAKPRPHPRQRQRPAARKRITVIQNRPLLTTPASARPRRSRQRPCSASCTEPPAPAGRRLIGRVADARPGRSGSHSADNGPARGLAISGQPANVPIGCAVSSVVEHFLDTEGVRGSSPLSRTNFSKEIAENAGGRTVGAQDSCLPDCRKVRFPKRIRFRRVEATIYGRTDAYPFYRLAYYVAGKRIVRHFRTYSEAKAEAERIVREIAKGSPAATLNGEQSRDALAALQRLEMLRELTGLRFSLLGAVSEFVEAMQRLGGRSLREAVEGYLQTVAAVRRKSIADAVEEFLAERRQKAEARNGRRPQLSASYEAHVAAWLRNFAASFPATAVCDLTKEHLNLYFKPLTDVGPKNRNDRRAVVKMFLSWATRQDYLPANHRLFEAAAMVRETVDAADVDFYRPAELQKLLDAASAELRPVLALAGLAGLRGEEIMRLDWADVWRVSGHVEIPARLAKTRQRRLVEICPALAAWLAPYREQTGRVFPAGVHVFQRRFTALREHLGIPARRNGLRHAFCTYHYALHANENYTAQQAGSSPVIVHAHYKGLATKAEAERWFAVFPKKEATP